MVSSGDGHGRDAADPTSRWRPTRIRLADGAAFARLAIGMGAAREGGNRRGTGLQSGLKAEQDQCRFGKVADWGGFEGIERLFAVGSITSGRTLKISQGKLSRPLSIAYLKSI